MFQNRSVNAHQFSMIPRSDVPRSTFNRESTHKTTFDAGYLVPIFVDEVLPGDTFNFKSTAFARMATPLYPLMDNLYLDTFYFFVPNRLIWDNWEHFMGQQEAPGDSISFVIPTVESPVGGYAVGSLQDYFGLPTVGQVGGANKVAHSVLPLRAYNLIFHEWFRDENLVYSNLMATDDGPDVYSDYTLYRRGKRHDYFTSCLPWPQKGSAVTMPLGTSAPVVSTGSTFMVRGSTGSLTALNTTGGAGANVTINSATSSASLNFGAAGTTSTGLQTDLSAATAATINAIRESFAVQKLLERDARAGSRYTEIVRSHFGVISPDARLQRPEYLGGGTSRITVNTIAQTSATGVTGGSTPVGTLSGMATTLNRAGFTQSFTEHGYIIGIANVRADLTYQQGLRKLWSRSTRYDFYFPVFANLGEQAVKNREIYCDGSANDNNVFGYQERWAEYRYFPSMVTGLFRSTSAGTLDGWHSAQKFTALPTLNATFINDTPPLSRNLAVGAAANGAQFLFDSLFENRVVRAMPLYSVPGLIDHF